MVQPSGSDSSNQQRGNKRPFSNAEGGPRSDHGGKFQRKSFDNRPFNKGGNRSFGRGGNRSFNNGNRFNKDNSFNRGRNNQNFGQGRGRGNQNFNRGNFQGRNNQNFRRGGFNKSWEGNRSAPEFEKNPNANKLNKHKKFGERTEEAAVDRVDNQLKDKKLKNPVQNVEVIDDESTSCSSESEEEIETNLQKNQNVEEEETSSESEEETSSESEEEIETSLNDLQKKQIVNENKDDEEEETSSESEEEIEVNSKTIQNKNEEDEEEISSESEDENVIIKESESKEQKKFATSSKIENQASSIYVRGLPHSTNKKQIGKFFERYGEIKYVESIKERFILITFKKAEDAKKALEVNGMLYKDHRISVRRHLNFDNKDDSKTIVAKKIPFDIRYEDLWNVLELTCGPIRKLVLPLPLKNSKVISNNKGVAFVEFELLDSKELALAMKQITIKDKVMELAQYVKERPRKSTEFLREAPFNKQGPRYSGGPSNVRVQQNQHNKSFTTRFGDNSYQGPPKFNARVCKKF